MYFSLEVTPSEELILILLFFFKSPNHEREHHISATYPLTGILRLYFSVIDLFDVRCLLALRKRRELLLPWEGWPGGCERCGAVGVRWGCARV